MDATDTGQAVEPRWRRRLRITGWIFAWLALLLCLVLSAMYAFLGDTTPLGEAFTTVPPVAWLAPLLLFTIPVLLARSLKAIKLLAIGALAIAWHGDWDSLFRQGKSWHRKTGIRVVTWNMAGQNNWSKVLQNLETWEPDIVMLQETPDGDASLSTRTLTGYWHGFDWWDQGDCGILSRYSLEPLESERVGPWDKPALAKAEIALVEGATTWPMLLCSVRLMMPVNATYPGIVPGIEDHEMRIRQYVDLASLVMERRREVDAAGIILGGDFNVRGNSRSLKPLRDAGLEDVWTRYGSGWVQRFLQISLSHVSTTCG